MNPLEEAHDLMLNPLPAVTIKDPLSRVYGCDNIIAKMESILLRIREERQAALNYAVKNNIVEEGRFRIEEKYRKTRTLNLEKFKAVFPDAYTLACTIERKLLEEQMQHVGEKLPLTTIDKLVPKRNLEAAPGVMLVKETITYTVVRK